MGLLSLHAIGFNFEISEDTMWGRFSQREKTKLQWIKAYMISTGQLWVKCPAQRHNRDQPASCLKSKYDPSITTKDMVIWLIVLKERHDQALLQRTWSCWLVVLKVKNDQALLRRTWSCWLIVLSMIEQYYDRQGHVCIYIRGFSL